MRCQMLKDASFSLCQSLPPPPTPLVKDSAMLFLPPSSSQVPSFCHVLPFLASSIFSLYSAILANEATLQNASLCKFQEFIC